MEDINVIWYNVWLCWSVIVVVDIVVVDVVVFVDIGILW